VVKSKLISQLPVLNKTTKKDGIGTIQIESTAYMSDVKGILCLYNLILKVQNLSPLLQQEVESS
jgi:hypothetical protein